MGTRWLITLFALTLFGSQALAQDAEPEPTPPTNEEITDTVMEEPTPSATYAGSWTEWPKMTGDWGGARTELADMGITLDIDVTQIFQTNMHGGAQTDNGARYSGSSDLTFTFDTGKMGLWQGGTIVLHADTKWGNGINGKVGSLLPVNFDAVLPNAESCTMTLSEWFIQQVLFDGKLVLIGGKLFGARAFDRNVFANDERTQFMNVAFRNTPMIPAFLPYTTMGLGVVVNPTDWLSVLTAVADSSGRADTIGFDSAFCECGDTGTTVIHEWAFKIKPCDLPGNQRVGFVWSSKNFNHLQPLTPFKQTGPMLTKLLGPVVMNKIKPLLPFADGGDNVALYYNFDQYLCTEKDDPTQGVGIFGRFAWGRQDVNAATHFYSLGVAGKGILPERDNDTCGLAYYFLDLSNHLPAGFHSEQGVEAYYNIEITPWLHISPDLQVIVNPGGTDDNDVSVVGGFRMQMNL